MVNSTSRRALVFLLLASGCQITFAQPSFRGMGDLPGGPFSSYAYGVSADGSVVVGMSNPVSQGVEATRWTAGGGLVGLGDLPGGLYASVARAASADGSVIVGGSSLSFDPSPLQPNYIATRWTAQTGLVPLGDLPGGYDYSLAYDVSADGQTAVGVSSIADNRYEAFRWTEQGMVGLGFVPGGYNSWATAVSADGSMVVGWSGPQGDPVAFRWTAATGMMPLGALPRRPDSTAQGVTPDGMVIVGASFAEGGTAEAFRWTADGGMVGLGDLPGGNFWSSAADVSADGSIIVGQGTTATGTAATIWDALHGTRNLKDVLLSDYGLDLAGWTLFGAHAISDDGRTIVGLGKNPNNREEGWIAFIPEPSTLFLLVCGCVFLRRGRRALA